jgi:hypothetical protein
VSKVSAVSMFVGWRGDSVWLGAGVEWPDDHPLVRAYPDYFADKPAGDTEPEKKARRPRGRREKAAPKTVTAQVHAPKEPEPPHPPADTPKPSGLSTFPSRTQPR